MMEVCDAASVGQSFPNCSSYFGDAYLRGQHRVSPPSNYPYNQNGQLQHSTSQISPVVTYPTTTTNTICTSSTVCSNFTSPRSYDYYSGLSTFNSATSYEPDRIAQLTKLDSCDGVCATKIAEHQPTEYPTKLPQPIRVDSKCVLLPKAGAEFPNSMSSPAGILTHNLSQWDVNDPKLPKIRQFDTFTMWPQGHCRFAYRKSASDGARRHASGWAMRNTNNHNSQILKKSCLGVLLCSTKRCPLAMRPAICDKARRRQEGRPCCMPNCNGRIYIQPCRGHGGYPVTHFWREHGDTVYFQSKGTHDHIRPDLKPVRDTAGRRRRQMQMDKESQLGVTRMDQFEVVHAKSKRAKDMAKLNQLSQTKKRNLDTVRVPIEPTLFGRSFQRPNEMESCHSDQMSSMVSGTNRTDNLANSKYQIGLTNHLELNLCHNNHGHISPLDLQMFPPTGQTTQPTILAAEPIFPSENSDLDIDPNPIEPKCSVYSSDITTKCSANPVNRLATTVPVFGDNLVDRSTVQLDPTMRNLNYDSFTTCITRSDHHHQQQQQHQALPTSLESNYPIYPLPTRLDDLGDKHSPFNKSNATSFYQSQVGQFTVNQPLTSTGGTNSESTSGGLNASWSTPSPPTGGSSSLFGELRTLPSGFDDTSSQHPIIPTDAKDSGVMTNMYVWNDEDYTNLPKPDPTINFTNFGGYNLATPTHIPLTSQLALGSDQSTVIPSLLMSSSTPVSYGRGLYPIPNSTGNRFGYSYSGTGYVAPIPFYLSSSDSQSTRTDSSSDTSHGSQRMT